MIESKKGFTNSGRERKHEQKQHREHAIFHKPQKGGNTASERTIRRKHAVSAFR